MNNTGDFETIQVEVVESTSKKAKAIGESPGAITSTLDRLLLLNKTVFIPLSSIVIWTVLLVMVDSILLTVLFSLALVLSGMGWGIILVFRLVNHINGG